MYLNFIKAINMKKLEVSIFNSLVWINASEIYTKVAQDFNTVLRVYENIANLCEAVCECVKFLSADCQHLCILVRVNLNFKSEFMVILELVNQELRRNLSKFTSFNIDYNNFFQICILVKKKLRSVIYCSDILL